MRGFRAAVLLGILWLGVSVAHGAGGAFERDLQWALGRKFLAEGKNREARDILAELSGRYPKEPDVYLFLAIASLRSRDPRRAEGDLEKSLTLDPDHVEARTLRGWIALEVKRDYAAAIADYTRVAELKPDWPEAHNNLGVAWKKRGDLEKAAASFDRALALRPEYGEAWSNLGWIHAEEKKWREARADFERALKSSPGDEGALYGLSQAQREVRDYAGAERTLKSLLSRAPNFVYWLEWGQVKLVRYYWVLLLGAGLIYLNSRYRLTRRLLHGGADSKEA
jgi:tetratricopeptide (TPR) repeat protein